MRESRKSKETSSRNSQRYLGEPWDESAWNTALRILKEMGYVIDEHTPDLEGFGSHWSKRITVVSAIPPTRLKWAGSNCAGTGINLESARIDCIHALLCSDKHFRKSFLTMLEHVYTTSESNSEQSDQKEQAKKNPWTRTDGVEGFK